MLTCIRFNIETLGIRSCLVHELIVAQLVALATRSDTCSNNGSATFSIALTRQMTLEHELLILQEHTSSTPVFRLVRITQSIL
jgi:hypothetical protein